MMTGAEIFIECLKRENVEVIFGYPGAAVLPIFDLLYDANPRFILTRHEQGAAHAADGFARASGKTGVCLATSGPGAVNLVTGIATAYMDSVPMVVITGQVKTSLIGNDAFQEADVIGITRSITKHNYLIKDAGEISAIISEAFYLAASGRPGPVLVDIPVDVQQQKIEFSLAERPAFRTGKAAVAIDQLLVNKAIALISAAGKPLICSGGGVVSSGAAVLLQELAEKIQAPVATTLMGMGTFPGDNPLYLGMPGMHGTVYANRAISEADLIIAVGMRFDDRVTGRVDAFAPNAEIIQIDIDPSSIEKSVRVDVPLIGDAGGLLRALLKGLVNLPDTRGWLARIKEIKTKFPLFYSRRQGVLNPQYVVEQISAATAGKAVIATDVGQNQMWAAQWYSFSRPRQFISSGGLGTMGFGLPAAMGAKIAFPQETVFVISGDGSFQMNLRELATCMANGINLKIAILNNGCLGMVRQWQELFYGRRYSHSFLGCPDFVRLAESYGAEGLLVTKNKQVRPAIAQALLSKKTFLIDFRVASEENVMPMVPAGEALDRMIGGMA